jgi:hypothetical protein
MNEIIINDIPVTIKEYQGQRVVTLKDIDTVHGRPDGTARRNFNTNKKYFIEGEDYFKITPYEFRTAIGEMDSRQQNDVTLITESGYLMLVKSFTDDLAWNVQRQLVKIYFRAKEMNVPAESTTTSKKLEIQEMNARTRMANLYLKLADVDTKSGVYKDILIAKAAEVLAGEQIIPLPLAEQKTYTATEIGEMFGISKQRVGTLANQYGMKIPEFGEWYRDKSPYSSKEVDAFRYNDKAIEKFHELLG